MYNSTWCYILLKKISRSYLYTCGRVLSCHLMVNGCKKIWFLLIYLFIFMRTLKPVSSLSLKPLNEVYLDRHICLRYEQNILITTITLGLVWLLLLIAHKFTLKHVQSVSRLSICPDIAMISLFSVISRLKFLPL